MTENQREIIIRAIHDKKNIIAAGGTKSGKTTLLNALLAEISKLNDRVTLIEDTPELQCMAARLWHYWTHGQRDTAAVVILFLTALGRDSVYGANRILDNGVDNDTAFAVRRDWTAKIFAGKGNRNNVQLSDKNFCGGIYRDAVGKYFNGTGRQYERNGDIKRHDWQHQLFLTSFIVRTDFVLHDEKNSGAGVGTFI